MLAERDEYKPSKWRKQHRPVVDERSDQDGPVVQRVAETLADDEGRVSYPYRVNDPIDVLESRGALTDKQAGAARRFQDDFAQASLAGYRCVDLDRVWSGGRPTGGDAARIIKARDRVYAALKVLGGAGSKTSAVVWAVFGLGETLRDYSTARKDNRMKASGMLATACDALAYHYGM